METQTAATNVINFAKAKQRLALDVISIGDRVEWSDWNGQSFQGRVTGISYLAYENVAVDSKDLTSFPIWEKSDYSVALEDGLEITGSVIVRKIPRGEKAKVAGQRNQRGSL